MIRLVVFDLDGGYFKEGNNTLAKDVADKWALDLDFVKEVLFELAAKEGGYNELKTGSIKPQKYWSWLLKTLGIQGKAAKEDLLTLIIKKYQPNPGAKSLLQRLKNKKIQSAICSNNWKDNIDALQKKFHFLNDFDFAVFSYEIGAMKPNNKIYEELIKVSKLRPEEIIYSDDKEENLRAAEKIGMQTVSSEDFNTFKKFVENACRL